MNIALSHKDEHKIYWQIQKQNKNNEPDQHLNMTHAITFNHSKVKLVPVITRATFSGQQNQKTIKLCIN